MPSCLEKRRISSLLSLVSMPHPAPLYRSDISAVSSTAASIVSPVIFSVSCMVFSMCRIRVSRSSSTLIITMRNGLPSISFP